MFHFTIFGATDAQMPVRGLFAMTIFGAADLRRPTLAQRVLDGKHSEPEKVRWWDRVTDTSQNSAMTVFGVTEVVQPNLVEEYSALRALLSTGAIDKPTLVAGLRAIAANDREAEVTTITIFGVFEQSRPSRNKQLKALANAEKAGLIPAHHKRRLDEVADAAPAQSIEVLGQLVGEMA